jgi:hypothetical protein
MMTELILAGLILMGAMVLLPVVVVGTWGLIVYGIVGAAKGVLSLLDRCEGRERERPRTSVERTFPRAVALQTPQGG